MVITCHLMGGLGNQLFQIFATIANSLQSQYQSQYVFLNQAMLGVRHTAWNTLLVALRPNLVSSLPHNMMRIDEQEFSYNPLPNVANANVAFVGYFQSEKYFKPYYKHIYDILEIGIRRDELKQKLVELEGTQVTISIHFRIGDYKNIQHCHPLMPLSYYVKSLTHIQSNTLVTRVVYFCEDVDLNDVLKMVEQLITQFPNYTFVRCNPKLADWEQMLYMSFCNHHIIANSSFSWWGAYFNPLNEKIVCYPSTWFGSGVAGDTKDLCPPEWVKI